MGCERIIFVVGNSITIKVQSVRHQDKSNAKGLIIEYVKTEDEAIEKLTEYGL